MNTPAGIAATFGNPSLALGADTLALPIQQLTTAISGTLQISDGSGGADDVMGVYIGTGNADTITLPIPGALNAVYGFAGNDAINLTNGGFVAGTFIDGGASTDSSEFDHNG